MTRAVARSAVGAAAAAMLSGCVAVAVPVVAGGALGARTVLGRKQAKPPVLASESAPARAPDRPDARSGDRVVTYLPPGSVLPPPGGVTATAAAAMPLPVAPSSPASSSTERAARDPWQSLLRFAAGQAVTRPVDSVVMLAGSAIAKPRWVACEDKPLAVIVDVERTGTPEARTALDALRTMGVGTVPMAGRPIPGVQRTAVAAKYCVVAILGDQPGDFSDQLRDADPMRADTTWADATAAIARLKGAGWFLATPATDGPARITDGKTTEGTPD